ncbi:hypothetical protein E1B28_013473 [Marasmius oreades]|uniref:ribonuclease H n=1 Tax=Marasmius oreades TaxID=181124 RepID=A0A9P7UM82_9AGAR|nr:uncharacterized protein E1B28_013473 [Marasmius oreades]KAG7087512.1 hypothetical protein E1B28_013473 [Marasmius oreades]
MPVPVYTGRLSHNRYLRLEFASLNDATLFVHLWNSCGFVILDAGGVHAVMGDYMPDIDVSMPSDVGVQNDDPPASSYILSWNVNGSFDAIVNGDVSHSMLENNDIILLQETHLYDGEHCPSLEGYTVFSRPGPRSLETDFNVPFGGVATLVRTSLRPVLREEFCGPDILAVEVSDKHPMQALKEIIAAADMLGLPYMIFGDFNARIASENSGDDQPVQISSDPVINSRGRDISQVCSDFGLTVLNGSWDVPGIHDGWTSHQKKKDRQTGEVFYQCAVVDYGIVSHACLLGIGDFTISDCTTWSDHSLLSVAYSFTASSSESSLNAAKNKSRPHFAIPLESDLDCMLDSLLSKEDPPLQDKLDSIYGRVQEPHSMGRNVIVYTDGSCTNRVYDSKAGCGVYFGPGSKYNRSYRVSGPQRNNRAELYVILAALVHSPSDRPLHIFSDSQYAIRSLTTWALHNTVCGWSCENGDLLRRIVLWINQHVSTVTFHWVKGHYHDLHNDAADMLPKAGTCLPVPAVNSGLDFESIQVPS